jgi:methylmalonyl-CoA epimerase
VQALKAGIMEIADIFVINKADREGADRMAASIEAMLSLVPAPDGDWRAPVLRTVATTGAGMAELASAIEQFRARTGDALDARRRARAEWRLRDLLGGQFLQHLERSVLRPGEFDGLLDRIASRDVDPYAAAAAVMTRAVGRTDRPSATAWPLDHVGIACRDAESLVAILRDLFGFEADTPEVVGPHRLRFIDVGGPTLELVEAVVPEAPVAKFIEKRGEGLHHLCVRVPDIEAAMARLKARGVRLIDERPRTGAHGSRIAFIHPSSAGGLLLEIKQPGTTAESER